MRLVAVILVAAACGGSPPPPPKPAEPPKVAKAPPPLPRKELLPAARQTHDADPMEALPDVPPPQLTGGGACDGYINGLEKLSQCQALNQDMRDALHQAAEQVRQAMQQYASMPEMEQSLREMCKQAVQQIDDYASQNGCP